MCLCVPAQFVGSCSFLSLYGFQESNSRCQTWWQTPLLISLALFFFLSFLYLIPSHSFPVWGARFSCSQYYLSNLHPIQAHSNAGSGLEKLEQKQLLPYRATVSSVTLDQLFNLSFSFFISTKGSYLLWVTAVKMIRIIFFNAYTRHSINYQLPI